VAAYRGERDRTANAPYLCDCGALASHVALFYRTDVHLYGDQVKRYVCTECAKGLILRDDPPRKIEALPAWIQWTATERRTARRAQEKANLEGQQRWDTKGATGSGAVTASPAQSWRATRNAVDGPPL
jgi:hypothetical protein